MAKPPAAESIQAPDKMKPLLALSKQEPVSAAVALTAEGEGLILLDKRAKPKKVRSMLRAAAQKAKLNLSSATIRFGRAEVDPDYDSSMVRFHLNKDAPGNMRVKLVEVVRRIPYQKVELNVDPSLEDEPEEEAEGQEAADVVVPPGQPEAPPPPPPPGADEHALKLALGAVIQRIPAAAGADTSRKANLLKAAGLANDQLKQHDLAAATATIAKLTQIIDAAAPGATPGAAPRGWPAARAAWQEASDAVDAQIGALQAKLAASGDERLEEIAEMGLNGVTGGHKVKLMAAMRDIDGGGAPDRLLAEIDSFAAHIGSDLKVMACDENPLGVPVTIRATLGSALAAMRSALA
jgi:hypothetical protein